MWVAASENVRVIGNDVSLSPIGLEVNVSVNVEVRHNDVHDNTVGIGLFHPNSAGNLPLSGSWANWVVEHNNVYRQQSAEPRPADGSFQGGLPPGVGILVLGVSDNVVAKNNVENNDFVGIGVLGWCTATATTPGRNCLEDPPIINGDVYDPSVSDNLIAQNKVRGNGSNPPDGPPFPIASWPRTSPTSALALEPFPARRSRPRATASRRTSPRTGSRSCRPSPTGSCPPTGAKC